MRGTHAGAHPGGEAPTAFGRWQARGKGPATAAKRAALLANRGSGGRHPSVAASSSADFAKATHYPKEILIQENENDVHGKTVAILVTDGFEQSELMEPRKALHEAGATTQVVSPAGPKVKGWNHKEWGNEVPVDIALESANAGQFDARLLPGGS